MAHSSVQTLQRPVVRLDAICFILDKRLKKPTQSRTHKRMFVRFKVPITVALFLFLVRQAGGGGSRSPGSGFGGSGFGLLVFVG